MPVGIAFLWHKALPCASERSSEPLSAYVRAMLGCTRQSLMPLKRVPIIMRNLFLIATLLVPLHAESGADAWLRYAPLDESTQPELLRGIRGMLGRTLRVQSGMPKESAIVLGTLADLKQAAPQLNLEADLPADGYWLTTASLNGVACIVIDRK